MSRIEGGCAAFLCFFPNTIEFTLRSNPDLWCHREHAFVVTLEKAFPLHEITQSDELPVLKVISQDCVACKRSHNRAQKMSFSALCHKWLTS